MKGENWGWFLAVGICFLVLGVGAFAWPVASTVGLTLAMGVLLVLAGLTYFVQAVSLRREHGSGWRVFHSIVSLAAGVLTLRYPAAGMMGITIAMAFYFFASSGIRGAVALGLRPLRGWGWSFVSAICSFVLGLYMIFTFPVSALWVPGVLLGVDFIVHGSTLIGFSLALRKFHRRVEEVVPPTRRAA